MRSVCRIFISAFGTMRSFYWFEYSGDHSIYFGSSNSKRFRIGFTGTGTSSATAGTPVDPAREFRPMAVGELGQKSSIHGSGVVHHGTIVNGRRERYVIAPPKDGLNTLPLVAVMPMHPSRYQVSTKKPKATDIVIDLGHGALTPFGATFYLNNTESLEPPGVIGAKSLYETFVTSSVPFGPYKLCVSIYADSTHMKSWSDHEGKVHALPAKPGGQPAWPFFANTRVSDP
jgi:hypothetical protein